MKVNLRVVTEQTLRLGVASHVCELHLVLRHLVDAQVLAPLPLTLDWLPCR